MSDLHADSFLDMNNSTSSYCQKLIAGFQSRNLSYDDLNEDEKALVLPCIPYQVINQYEGLKEYRQFLYIYIVTAVLGAIGNTAVLVFYGKKFSTLSPWKFLVFHLACCDLLFAVMQVLLALPSLTDKVGYLWPVGLPLCKIALSAPVLGSMIAVQNILIIAVERYKGILHPFTSHSGTKKRIKLALVVAWIFGLLSSIPALLAAEIVPKEEGECTNSWKQIEYEIAYKIHLLVVFGLFPLVALAFLYGRIMKSLLRPDSHAIVEAMSEDQARQRRNTDKRVIKMLLAVVVVFFLCVMPNRIVEVAKVYSQRSWLSIREHLALLYCGSLTYPFHVAVNPVIYCFMDKEFRKAVIPKCKGKAGSEGHTLGTVGTGINDAVEMSQL